jgi:superfamily I DNA/RNA helicase
MATKQPKAPLTVETLKHGDATRKNIPTAEYQSVMAKDEQKPVRVEYKRAAAGDSDEKAGRNRDLDPQLVWRGKDEQDWSNLIVQAPPLYIQEKVHPKVLIDDLKRQSEKTADAAAQVDLFADFNGLPNADAKTEFYQHDGHWANRMILGDSLSVMASLAEREGLRGRVQCIYFDPPYGIKFNSNFQWSTTSRDVKDGNAEHITREPEQVKAFRDTWRDGIHSYLTYLRDRLTVARDLLTESGSIFVQIGDENVHRLQSLMDEVFGQENFVAKLVVQKTTSATNVTIPQVCDFVLWFSKRKEAVKYRALYRAKSHAEGGALHYNQVGLLNGTVRAATDSEREGVSPLAVGEDFVTLSDLQSASMGRDKGEGAASWFPVAIGGREFRPTEKTRWKTNEQGMGRLTSANRINVQKTTIRYKRKLSDFSVYGLHNIWTDIGGAPDRRYVVETTDAQRRFRVMNDVDELERALSAPWEKWITFLHPAQRDWVERDYSGPARVSGSAGTGKTIVALHRAVFLARKHPDSRVLLATFSEPLASALHQKLRLLISGTPRLAERLEVQSVIGVGERLYAAKFGRMKIASRREVKQALTQALGNTDSSITPALTVPFVQSEWDGLIDECQVESWDAYRVMLRLGRKTKLPEARRAAVWAVAEKGREILSGQGLLTYAQMFSQLAQHYETVEKPPFDFIVVDEAQDVSVAQLKFLAALGGQAGVPKPNGLFFAGDLGQRIFQLPFSWKSLGVDVRGRAGTLTVNYRTSHQIRSRADRLLGPEVSDVDENVETRNGTISVFNGQQPSIRTFESEAKEIAAVGDWLKANRRDGVRAAEMAVFVRSKAEIDRACMAVKAAGLEFCVLDDKVRPEEAKVSICSMHLAKGLEFRAVVVMACDDEVVPLQSRIQDIADNADLKEVYDTERHLLYVACTRARDRLLVTAAEPASEFLDDLTKGF